MAALHIHIDAARKLAVANAGFSSLNSIQDPTIARSVLSQCSLGVVECLSVIHHDIQPQGATSNPEHPSLPMLVWLMTNGYRGRTGLDTANYLIASYIALGSTIDATYIAPRAALTLSYLEAWTQMILIEDEVKDAEAHGRRPNLSI